RTSITRASLVLRRACLEPCECRHRVSMNTERSFAATAGMPSPTSMRYIGNKTRLLRFILHALDRLGILPRRAHDAFAGTAAVGRALKAAGWSVVTSDLMTYSYVLQRAYVVTSRASSLTTLLRHEPALRAFIERHDAHHSNGDRRARDPVAR